MSYSWYLTLTLQVPTQTAYTFRQYGTVLKRILDDRGQICKSKEKDMLHNINKFKEHGVSWMHRTYYFFLFLFVDLFGVIF